MASGPWNSYGTPSASPTSRPKSPPAIRSPDDIIVSSLLFSRWAGMAALSHEGFRTNMTTSTRTAARPSAQVTPGIVADLIAILGSDNVLSRRDEMLVYECDGYMVEKSVPDVVVFPTST